MKKLIVSISFICLMFSSNPGFAQWQTDLRLTNNPANSFVSQDKGIAVYGNNIHVVWQDHRDAEAEVYYKRSTNSGASWSADLRLSPLNNYSGTPTIALYQSTIHIFWVDQRIGPLDIYYVRSTDNGVTWQPETSITTDLMNSSYPSVSVSGSNIYLCWEDDRDLPNKEIYFKRSANSGINWSSDVRLTADTSASNKVSVTSFGQNIHLVWTSGSGNSEIYYKSSSNGGVNWSSDQRMTNDPAVSFYPCIAISGQNINIFWSDLRDGNSEIYFKRSSDGGTAWSSETRLTNAVNNSLLPNAIAFGQLLAVVWGDLRLNFYKIYYKVSTNGGLNWSTDLLLSPVSNTGFSNNPSIDVSDSAAHVIWEDSRDGNLEIYYKKNIFSLPVGISNNNSEIPAEFSLSQNYPNPFNPSTTINFQIPAVGGRHVEHNNKVVSEIPQSGAFDTQLIIYDIIGKEVKVLVNKLMQPGTYSIDFDGSSLASGMYFYKLTLRQAAMPEGRQGSSTGDFTITKKMLMIK